MKASIDTFNIPCQKLNKVQIENLKQVKNELLNLITKKITDEQVIEHLLDRLLDLIEWFGDDIEEIFYLLLNYYKQLNESASIQYEKIYLELINEYNFVL